MLTRAIPIRALTHLADEEVVDRVRSGDTALFELLMRRHNARVYRTIRAVLRDEAEVEDAMQASYVTAYANLGGFRGDARFSTWLTRIALNEGLGRLRRHRRHPATSLSLVEEPEMSTTVEPPRTPEDDASRREVVGLLERAVDELPEDYRVTFVLREIDGMDTRETAAALDVSEDVIKTRLSRARAMLRAHLERTLNEAAREAFGFHAARCDRVVARVLEVIRR